MFLEPTLDVGVPDAPDGAVRGQPVRLLAAPDEAARQAAQRVAVPLAALPVGHDVLNAVDELRPALVVLAVLHDVGSGRGIGIGSGMQHWHFRQCSVAPQSQMMMGIS